MTRGARVAGFVTVGITDDVPEGALAIARARQANVEGYAEEFERGDGEKSVESERKGDQVEKGDRSGLAP